MPLCYGPGLATLGLSVSFFARQASYCLQKQTEFLVVMFSLKLVLPWDPKPSVSGRYRASPLACLLQFLLPRGCVLVPPKPPPHVRVCSKQD